MTNAEFFQILLAALAAVFAVTAGIRLIRTPRWHIAVLLAQILLVPEAALVWAVLHPGSFVLTDTNFFVGVFVIAFVAVIAMGWSVFLRRRLMRPAGIDTVKRQQMAALISRFLVILMTSGFLFAFAPWFALANLLLNAAWTAIWIPRAFRRMQIEDCEDIAAPVAEVFARLVDTRSWRGVLEGTTVVEPPGLLMPGTQIIGRQRIPSLSGDPRIARVIETRSEVTSVTPNEGYATAVKGYPGSRSGIALAPGPRGTRATSWLRATLLFREAASGLMFELPAVTAMRRGEMRDSLTRLREASEQARPSVSPEIAGGAGTAEQTPPPQ